MSDEAAIDAGEEDRLPWLEAVDEDEDDGVGIGKLVAGILIALLAIALVIGGIFWLRGGDEGASGELIAAPEESYRVRPEEAGGMEVEGEGDAAFAASEGDSPEGRIDPSAVPEEPVSGRPAAQREAPARTESSARLPESGGRLAESAPRRTAPAHAATAASGRLIQLGAFSSEAAANRAWASLSGRYNYLGSLTKSVTTVRAGGRTLYRLRADAGSADAARSICDRLRVASEACSVVVN